MMFTPYVAKSYVVNLLFGHVRLETCAQPVTATEHTITVDLKIRLLTRWFTVTHVAFHVGQDASTETPNVSLGELTRYRSRAFQPDRESRTIRSRTRLPERCVGMLLTHNNDYRCDIVVDETTLTKIKREDFDLYTPMFQELAARIKTRYRSHGNPLDFALQP